MGLNIVKKMMWLRSWTSLGVMAFAISPSVSASVDCERIATSYTIPGSTITVQRDAVINTPISAVIYGNQTNAYKCTITNNSWGAVGISSRLVYHSTIGSKRVYETTLPGVGVAIGAAVRSASFFITEGISWVGDKNSIPVTGVQGTPSVIADYLTQPYIQFYKIGPMKSGVTSGSVGVVFGGSSDKSYIATEIPVSFGTTTVNVLACSIDTPVIQVPLDDILGTELTAVGTTAKPKTFNLGLDCDAGARVNVQMAGTQNTDTDTAGVLQLTNAGSAAVAKGVGIQVLYNNEPLALNKNMVLKTSAGGKETFPFIAQYYQTKDPVSSGSANATMTLNVIYQ